MIVIYLLILISWSAGMYNFGKLAGLNFTKKLYASPPILLEEAKSPTLTHEEREQIEQEVEDLVSND